MQYRRLLRALHDLRTEVLEPAPGLLTEILAKLEAAGERRAVRSLLTGRARSPTLGGLAAATAAGRRRRAIVLASRARQPRRLRRGAGRGGRRPASARAVRGPGATRAAASLTDPLGQ